jgi:hypothetical protein
MGKELLMAKGQGRGSGATQAEAEKQPWQKMELTYVGDAAELIQGGGGKLSIAADDTGDAPRKPKGLG